MTFSSCEEVSEADVDECSVCGETVPDLLLPTLNVLDCFVPRVPVDFEYVVEVPLIEETDLPWTTR